MPLTAAALKVQREGPAAQDEEHCSESSKAEVTRDRDEEISSTHRSSGCMLSGHLTFPASHSKTFETLNLNVNSGPGITGTGQLGEGRINTEG